MSNDTAWVVREFVAGPDGTVLNEMAVSRGLDAAMDVLQAAGMKLTEERMRLLVGAEQGGRDPEQLAQKLVRLSQSLSR